MSDSIHPPAEVTAEQFHQWRNARRGTRIAEDMSNPYWSWLIESETSSWRANEHFGGPSSFDAGAAWSPDRFGQSRTTLPDGREVLIAGEHEDFYDPDFYIYNDIIIRHPGGRIEILGFPEAAFPPTDFHSATLVDDQIILIGNLGYPPLRKAGRTQILVIDTATWEIRSQPSTGEGPGWIHRHQAEREEGSILIRGGEVWTGPHKNTAENFDDWRLHLSDWRWERLTHRPVTVFELERADGEKIRLHDMRSWIWQQKNGPLPPLQIPDMEDSPLLEEIRNEMAGVAPKDREAFERLYKPDGVEHEDPGQPDDSMSLQRQIRVQGVLVRYDEDFSSLRLTIEGELPQDVIRKLRDDLKSKIERADGAPYIVRQVKP